MLNEIDDFIFIERFQSIAVKWDTLFLSFWRDEAAVAAWLYEFLNYTHKLKLLVENTVTENISPGGYNTEISDDVWLDAHRIHDDEVYHVLYLFGSGP